MDANDCYGNHHILSIIFPAAEISICINGDLGGVRFPVIDMLFGTFYLPKGRWPEQYGVTDLPYSNSYWSQFIGPIKK